MDSPPNINVEALPLDAFYSVLQQNGFTVTPGQIIHAQQVMMQYGGWVKNEGELCHYLAPVFASDEEAQELFIKLFNTHLKSKPLPLPAAGPHQPPLESWMKRHWKIVIFVYAVLSLLVLAVILVTATRHKHFRPELIDVTLVDKKTDPLISDKKIFQTKTGEPLELELHCTYSGKRTELTTQALYNWGDSVENDMPGHTYSKAGAYTLRAKVWVLYKGDTLKRYRIVRSITVCDEKNDFILQTTKSTASLRVNDVFYIIPKMKSPRNAGMLTWWVDEVYMGRQASIRLSYHQPGTHVVTAANIVDSVNAPCTVQNSITINIDTDHTADTTLHHTKNASPLLDGPAPKDDNTPLYHLYIGLAIAFAMLSVFFLVLWGREQNKAGHIRSGVLSKYNKIVSALQAQKAPGMLPFSNKNYIPVKELEIEPVVKKLRRRVKDTISFLHIKKTISKTIEQAGLFTPVNEPRTRPSEYLILADHSDGTSMMNHQMEYLTQVFKRHGVLFDTYYYGNDPSIVYNDNEPAGVSFEKLFNRYQRHVLIVLGNGHQFINHNDNSVDEKWAAAISRWQHKALITPVSFINWQQKEKDILMPVIPVVPADMEGLALLADILSTDAGSMNVLARLNLNKGAFYDAENFDFYSVNGLLDYVNQANWTTKNEYRKTINVLLEWISALAVYPTLRWEILLVTGNVIFEQYEKSRWLNYSTLLRMVRIPWMKEGRMPDSLRLELLQRMPEENEILIRQILLQLLHEIPETAIDTKPELVAEKEVQQIINEFSLYAHDPEYFSGYRQSKAVFEKLWKEKRLNDQPLEDYLANENNEWKTILGNNAPDKPGTNKVNSFLLEDDKEETLLSKLYLVLAIISIVVTVGSLFALRIIYIWDQTTY